MVMLSQYEEEVCRPEVRVVQQHLWLDRIEQSAVGLEVGKQALIACQ